MGKKVNLLVLLMANAGTINASLINQYIKLSNAQKELLGTCIEQGTLTARSCNKVLRVAQTIADLDNKKEITDNHISEALHYRKTFITK